MQQDASSATDEQPSSAAALAAEGASQAPFGPGSPNGRYRDPSQSTPSSTASSDSEDDDPGPDQPRRGDDRNLRIDISNSGPTAPALATPNARLMGSHPWPFTSQTSTFGGSNGEQAGASATAAQTARARAGSVTEWLKQVEAPQFGRRMDDIVPASSMPHEILLQILRSVSATSDLRRALLVCKAWCQCGVELLWHKPSFPSTTCLIKMLVTLASKTQTFPYASFIRRLNFSGLAENMSDHILLRLVGCHRLERLTLSSCSSVSDDAIIKMLRNVPDLVALDLSDCKLVTDATIVAAAEGCPKLQGLNLTGCKNLTDIGLGALRQCRALRRLKLKSCDKITDAGLIQIAANCPLLLEVDLVGCKFATNATLWTLWKNSSHLRELSLTGLVEISDGGFPSAENALMAADGETDPITGDEKDVGPPVPPNGYLAPKMHYDHIRFLDLTSLAKLSDEAVAGIVRHMPRIRNLVLAKCSNLTDDSLSHISKLGKHLHYLHLGHVGSLTDRAVIRLARACTRLRYIDLACCTNLTDMSVFELATCLPRLKRIGLVRVTNITDASVSSLLERTSLERIHLSYCDNISVGAIHSLLQRLHRLTHLSLTGVPAFRRTDLQTFCRAPPKDFNNHQRQAFCVYSGKGVNELRRYLSALYYTGSNQAIGEDGLPDSGNDASVFNTLPDQRTMAMAMAAVRAQSTQQPNGVHSSRRRFGGDRTGGTTTPLGQQPREGRVVHPLPQGRAGGPPPVNLPQFGGLPDEPQPHAGPSSGVLRRLEDHGGPFDGVWDHRQHRRPNSAGGSGSNARTEAQAGHDFFSSAIGSLPTFTLGGARNQSPALQSPIPLYSPADRHNLLNQPGNSSAGPSSSTTGAGSIRGRAFDDAALGLAGPLSASRDRVASSDGTIGGARPRTGTLVRRRSEQEINAGGNANAGSGADGGSGAMDGGPGRRRGASALGLEVPDRTDSASPMDISDDERPPMDPDFMQM